MTLKNTKTTAEIAVETAFATSVSSPKVAGMKLVPANGHMEKLIQLSMPVHFDTAPTNILEDVKGVVHSMETTRGSGGSHAVQLEDLADLYLKPTVQRIDTFRRRLLPFIGKCTSMCDARYSKEVYILPEIKPVQIPEVYYDQRLVEAVKGHPDISAGLKSIQFSESFSPKTEEELLKCLPMGNTTFYELLLDLIATKPKEWIVEVYNKYMVNGGEIPTLAAQENALELTDELIILYFILGNYVTTEYVDGSVNLGLKEYLNYLSSLFGKVGAVLRTNLNKIKWRLDMGSLVLYNDTKAGVIYVISDLYDKYLADGGSADALFGALLEQKSAFVTDLLQNQAKYVALQAKDYELRTASIANGFKNKMVSLFRSIYPIAFAEEDASTKALLLSCITGKDIDPINPHPDDIIASLNAIANTMMRSAETDLYGMIAHGVLTCGVMKNYRFYELFTAMQAETELNPNRPVSEILFDIILAQVASAIVEGNIGFQKGQ